MQIPKKRETDGFADIDTGAYREDVRLPPLCSGSAPRATKRKSHRHTRAQALRLVIERLAEDFGYPHAETRLDSAATVGLSRHTATGRNYQRNVEREGGNSRWTDKTGQDRARRIASHFSKEIDN